MADLSQTGGTTAVVRAGGTEIATLVVPSPPTMPTVPARLLQFMAIGREDDFPCLHKLDELSGRVVDNAGFVAVPDPAALSDDEFYGKIMIEFPLWWDAARSASVLG